MSAKQDPEKLMFLLETKYFSYSTLFADHEVLEMGLQEMMQKDAKQPRRPYKAQKVIKKSKNTCVVCCFMGKLILNTYDFKFKSFRLGFCFASFVNEIRNS